MNMIYILYLIPIILGIYYIANGIAQVGVSRFLPPLVIGPLSLGMILWCILGDFTNDVVETIVFLISVVLSSAFLFTSMLPTEETPPSKHNSHKVKQNDNSK